MSSHLEINALQLGFHFLCFELVGDGPFRRLGCKAQSLLLRVTIDFQHDTINGEGQFVAFHVPIVDELEDFVDGLAKCHIVRDVEAPFLGGLQALVVGLVAAFEVVHHHIVAIIVESAAGYFLAVLQFKRSSGSVARVGEEVVTSLGACFVQSVETLEGHHNFASHLEKVGIVAVELERNGADGAHIGGHVVALGAVATGHGADEHAVFVLQADAQPVKLQLAAKLHFLVNGLFDAVDKFGNLLSAVGIGK